MIKITHTDGSETWVNPDHITSFKRLADQTVIRVIGDKFFNTDMSPEILAQTILYEKIRMLQSALPAQYMPYPPSQNAAGISGSGGAGGGRSWFSAQNAALQQAHSQLTQHMQNTNQAISNQLYNNQTQATPNPPATGIASSAWTGRP